MNEIKQITRREANQIIEKREPRGLFYLPETGFCVGIDNSTGDAWVEDFDNKKDCLNWLNGKEVNAV